MKIEIKLRTRAKYSRFYNNFHKKYPNWIHLWKEEIEPWCEIYTVTYYTNDEKFLKMFCNSLKRRKTLRTIDIYREFPLDFF